MNYVHLYVRVIHTWIKLIPNQRFAPDCAGFRYALTGNFTVHLKGGSFALSVFVSGFLRHIWGRGGGSDR